MNFTSDGVSKLMAANQLIEIPINKAAHNV
jgi:hypothetical protein